MTKKHSLGRHLASGRLVHVIPNPSDSGTDMLGVSHSPPLSCFGQGEIGKDRPSWPNLSDVGLSLPIQANKPIPHRLVVNWITGLLLDARIDDRDKAQLLRLQALDELSLPGKLLGVPSENPEFIHVVDVDPKNVAG